jgi:hypothetical protein
MSGFSLPEIATGVGLYWFFGGFSPAGRREVEIRQEMKLEDKDVDRLVRQKKKNGGGGDPWLIQHYKLILKERGEIPIVGVQGTGDPQKDEAMLEDQIIKTSKITLMKPLAMEARESMTLSSKSAGKKLQDLEMWKHLRRPMQPAFIDEGQ